MRRDAALYEAAPKKTGKAGRPRKKGKRLLSPAVMAAKLRDAAFTSVTVEWRGGTKDLLVWSRQVLWYTVDKEHLVQPVIVRDPTRRMHDDFFVTTDLTSSSPPTSMLHPPGSRRTMPAGGNHRMRQSRSEAGHRSRGPPVLEVQRSRTCRLALAVALCSHLVHPDSRDHDHLDPASLVSEEGHPELPRCARRPASLPVVGTNYADVVFRATQPENSRRHARRAQSRRIGTGPSRGIEHIVRTFKSTKVHPE